MLLSQSGTLARDATDYHCTNKIVSLEEHPYLVSVEFVNVKSNTSLERIDRHFPRDHKVVGTIISADYVLSVMAFPCQGCDYVVRVSPDALGIGGFKKEADLLTNENFTDDQNWASRPYHNIVLLKLRKPIEFDSRAKPIDLPENTRKSHFGNQATLIGWTDESSDSPQDIQKTELVISEKDACSGLLKYTQLTGERLKKLLQENPSKAPPNHLRDGFFCAQSSDPVVDACPSVDLGSPLIAQGELVGVKSARFLTDKTTPSTNLYLKNQIYVDVVYHRSWIRNLTGI
ncbi:hypothetical protein QAD02_017433 [Eretmocerus hayati]|uniref:Uncharacterized protein n=1 Tax=Eretmocerus hayati TaxID=131215 RepID=A0ACC2PFP5_9HYME|nr:hypothetical protein QAD02_017433 [Eretmocerus hayati]